MRMPLKIQTATTTAADSTRRPSAGVQRCRGCRGPRRPPRGSPPGPSARRAMRRAARTSDRGCHIVTSAGIAVPVLQMAPGAADSTKCGCEELPRGSWLGPSAWPAMPR